jgi:hypothetical protein
MQSNIVKMPVETKVCKGCNGAKPFSAYGAHGAGLRSRCKECRHEEYKAKRGHSEDLRQTVQLIEGGRVCLSCEKGKSWNEFTKDKYGYNQKAATCKECKNARYKDPRGGDLKSRPDKIKRLYGVTYEHVVQVLASQFGMCANRACGEKISLDVPLGKGRAVIDHDHATGKFRALLCPGCNSLLGSIETKQNLMIGLHEYLIKFRQNS